MEKINIIKPKSEISKSEDFALQLFLCFSLHNVIQHMSTMKPKEQEWVMEQVIASAEILFPVAFEAEVLTSSLLPLGQTLTEGRAWMRIAKGRKPLTPCFSSLTSSQGLSE